MPSKLLDTRVLSALGIFAAGLLAAACAGNDSARPAPAPPMTTPGDLGAPAPGPMLVAGAGGAPALAPGGSGGGPAANLGGVPGTNQAQAGRGSLAAGAGAIDSGSGPANAGSMAMPAAGCGSADPLTTLLAFAPDDEDLAGDYEQYLREELGSLTCATEGRGGARTIVEPIFVPPNSVYDGRGERLTADVAMMRCDTSEGEQAESQRPFFVLAPGAQLKNVTITYPGCEGVHMMGDNVLENIVWEDAGEDAASVRSYFPGGKILIKGSEGHKAADKMFQFNAACDVRIEGFTGSDMGKLVRQNGGTEFELRVDLNDVTVTGVISAVVQSDSPLCFVRHHALSYQFTGSGDKSDRVFRDVPPANVSEY